MLRLKQALQECGIPQKVFVDASGWSKTQISLTLGSGKLPAGRERFVSDVMRFVQTHDELASWLAERSLPAVALLETGEKPGPGTGDKGRKGEKSFAPTQSPVPGPGLYDRLLMIAGEAAMFPDDIAAVDIIVLTRACSYLLMRLEPFSTGTACRAPTDDIESRVMDILEGL